ncbi:protein of unknown function [Rhodospira trueperi]|uniref:Antirestriction protein ArdC n=1 Tax=Rhodospira trueperi TaxID=69960 RepID=A0A1G6W3A1_9PROT|nr:protein of unknown function [Rhodospira trueperi]
MTFRQAKALGGTVRKGERGTTVVYADRFVPEDERRRALEKGEDPQAIPFLKRFTVFNTDQCDDLPEDIATTAPPVPEGLILPRAEALIAGTRVDFRIGGNRAFYNPLHDFVQVPPPQAYFEPVNWHRTALHELGHATGPRSRLDRDMSGSFGSRKYAFEELGAEITAAFTCAAPPIALGRSACFKQAADRNDPRRPSSRPCVTPITSPRGWTACARTTAPSSPPPARPARPPTG